MNFERNGLEIAIIGMVGRFPGSKNIASFWQNLVDGVELTAIFPNQTVKAGGVLNDVDLFDAAFFGFNPRDAEALDPQHRLFLECAWEVLENAGYNSETEARAIGVYAGVGMGTYLLFNLSRNQDFMASRSFLQTLIGVDKDYLPTRVSYKLNLTGPSVSVGTACSSSLVAVHLASQSLLSGECDMALAAGVSIKVPQDEITLSPDEIVSPDGHCRAFDAEANGTIGGNGVGVVLLKRLEDAIADRDNIYAIIKGSAINNDGALKVGYTAPSETGQAQVIQAAQIMAEVEPETITYLETHGTGTGLGDPIEVAAMTKAFRVSTDKKSFCAIGSVKPNIGHLDAAAGIAGLIKTVLALKHKLIPPSLNFHIPNPQIDFTNSPFYVNTELAEWKTDGIPRRAGVSSFGFGGTNVHVILEEAPVSETQLRSLPAHSEQLLVLSAKTDLALETAITHLVQHLKQHPNLNLADVAYTLQVGRRAFNHRFFVIAKDVEEAILALEAANPEKFTQTLASRESSLSTTSTLGDRSVIFMFPGQGAEYVNMAKELYQNEVTFRQECDRCCELLCSHLGFDLRSCLYPEETALEVAAQKLQQTAIAQPALFVIEYALAKLWISWGVIPQCMIGHSIGEYVAATLADVFSLEDALALVAARGKMMEPILASFTERIQQVNRKPPQIPYISNLTGTWITGEQATDPTYWAAHLSYPVHFAQGLNELCKNPEQILLEVGPGRTLSQLVKQHPDKNPQQVVLTSVRHPQELGSDVAFLYKTLGELWLSGITVNWTGFNHDQQRHRLPLPTYPFERLRYWINPAQSTSEAKQFLSDKKSDITGWFYTPTWKRSAVSLKPFKELKTIPSKQWLVFFDTCGVSAQVVEQLKYAGQDVIVVRIAEQFSKLSDGEYTINPQERDDYDALFRDICTANKIPQTIVHLWNVTLNDSALSRLDYWEKAQELGFYSLMFLVQALSKQNINDPLQIDVISNNMQELFNEEELCPEKATVLGICKVITQEYSNINCRSIDITLPSSGTKQWQQLIDKLLAELVTKTSEQVIAYRGNHRWVQDFAPLLIKGQTQSMARLREGGVYLIIGGLGKIGLIVSEYLAKAIRAKLVLTGRSGLPPKPEWQQWLLNHDEQDIISTKIKKVQALEALGAEVLVIQADVSHLEQMQSAIAQIGERFGQIQGVIHCAAALSGSLIREKSLQIASSVLEPKVKGTLVLDSVLKDFKPEFLVLFSSITAIVGGLGQADYCAANIFLDTFAHYNCYKQNMFTVSINWDAWQENDMQDELMSSYGSEILAHFREFREKYGINSREGIQALNFILSTTVPQVIVSTQNLQYRNEQFTRLLQNIENNRPKFKNPRPNLATPYIAPKNEVESRIARIYQDLLGIEQIGINDNFFNLGGDSLTGIQLMSRISQDFQIEIFIDSLFQTPSIAELALIVEEAIIQELQELAEVSNPTTTQKLFL
jgi:acyl transferase domain-containing protein/acyl carrier protein